MRALIVDNEASNREMLEQTLAEQGFTSDVGDTIDFGQTSVEANLYDIICINQTLKDGSGEKLVEYCNRQENHQNTPMLFLTGDRQLSPDNMSVRVDGIIHEVSRHQMQFQVIHFVELHLDPVFFEGRILFVEDDEAVSADILAQLEQTGYRVSHFRTPEEAWKEFKQVKVYGSHPDAYDLAITEVDQSDGMNGELLVDKIRSISDGRGFIPIITITENNDDQHRISLFHQGVNDLLPKPVLHEELLVRISNLITNKRLLDKVHDIRRELHSQATTDKLTGCHNRHSMMEFSEKFISQARRHEYPVAMLVIDLDHFKAINDNHGHATGDIVLQRTGALLNSCFREEDLVTRYGGEEFVVLMTHCDGTSATTKAEEIRVAIENLNPEGLPITTSIGVSSVEVGSDNDFEALFHAGDEGVYKAKENGRNQVVYIPLDPNLRLVG